MINDLIALLFFVRDYAHRAHLRTGSYSQHKALEAFYSDMTEAADKLTETYQGRFMKLLEIGYIHDEPDPTQPQLMIEKYWRMVREIRYKAVPREETMLQNQLDEIEQLFASVTYKLKFLK
jgi:Family of unknown function (DUF5856)